jgi:hypothetical protein
MTTTKPSAVIDLVAHRIQKVRRGHHHIIQNIETSDCLLNTATMAQSK